STTYTVNGTHIYAEEGAFTVTVTITHETAPVVSATSTATVADAALTASATANPQAATEGLTSGDRVVATFTDADPGGVVGDYRGTINWGDGTTPDSGAAVTFSLVEGTTFNVHGTHTYA